MATAEGQGPSSASPQRSPTVTGTGSGSRFDYDVEKEAGQRSNSNNNDKQPERDNDAIEEVLNGREPSLEEGGDEGADDDGDSQSSHPPGLRNRKSSFWYRDEKQRKRIPFAQRSLRITWGWFPVTMSTGAMASLIAQQPYTFRGLHTIGTIFYIVDLVFFCVFSLLIAGRFARKIRALPTSLHHPSESFFFGSWWVSLALLITGAQVYGTPHCGEWLVQALRIVFWMYFGCALVVAVFQYQVIFHAEKLMLSDALPAWILPAYPFLVTGVMAATLSKSQPESSAVQMLIAGIAGQGLGWMLALFIYIVYLIRLISSKMPPPSLRPGMYISVGPAAYTCAGLLSLGHQAKTQIPDDFLGLDSVPVGHVWYFMSVPAALFLWLLAIWFSALSTVSIIRDVGKMKFSLTWWAFVFPNAGLAIAFIQIGNAFSSKGIKVTASVLTVILVPLWFFCLIMHVRSVWRHDLLAPGRDVGVEDVNRAHDEKQKKRDLKRSLKKGAKKYGRRYLNPMSYARMMKGQQVGTPSSEGSPSSTEEQVGGQSEKKIV